MPLKSQDSLNAVINTKLEYIQKSIDTINEKMDKIDQHESRISSLETKTGMYAAFQAAFTVIVTSIVSVVRKQ